MRNLITIISLLGLLLSCDDSNDDNNDIIIIKYEKMVESIKVDFLTRQESDKDATWTVADSEIIKFSYDNYFRLTSIKSTKDKPIAIEYHSDMIVETSDSDSVAEDGVTANNTLNDNGVVVAGEKLRKEVLGSETFEFPKAYTLRYNADGYLTNRVITTYNSDLPINTIYTWEGDNLAEKSTEESYKDSSAPNTNNISFSYADCVNNANLDLNVILTDSYHSLLDFPTLIRKTGKSSKNLVSKVVDRYEMPSKFWDESRYRFEYELDGDGYVVKVKRYFSFRYDSQPEDSIPEELFDAIYTFTYNK